ncbi:MAG: adenylate/guanylate cyclase domain-containing protein [Chitinophagaceae bacterium]
MIKISLKNIIGKKNEAVEVILSLIKQLNIVAWVEDNSGKVLLGSLQENTESIFPLKVEEEVMGYVKGDEKAVVIAQLLTHLLQKETEKKKLGSEVLHLYQEVNLMFDFSDKLAKNIDAADIAKTTLAEAGRVIRSDNGVVVLWDEKNNKLQVIASTGELFFDQEKINSELSVLLSIILSGQSEIITDTSALRTVEIVLPHIKSIIYSALKVNHRVMGAVILASNEDIQYTAADLKLLTTLALQSSAAIESALLYEKNIREANEREEAMRKVYEVTGKFVPFEFIRSLGHNVITDVRLGDQVEKIVTVLFSDIREYTTIAEQMTPEENFRFVCSFNERMGPFIRQHNGFVNQYLGDAIMAIFPGNAVDALSAAVDMQKELEQFNIARKLNNQSPICIGVGMHTGPLIMGITGDNERLDACTISDTVNTASRLESLTKHYKAGIILSDACLEQIKKKGDFHLRNLGYVQLKGKQESIKIHECFSGNSNQDILQKTATLSLFNDGVSHYLDESFILANEIFEKVSLTDPGDRTAQFFFNNTREIMESGLPKSKAGVVEMQEK